MVTGDDSVPPDYARAISERAISQGIGESVRRVGICHDMPAAYAISDFVVVPATAPPTLARAAAEALFGPRGANVLVPNDKDDYYLQVEFIFSTNDRTATPKLVTRLHS